VADGNVSLVQLGAQALLIQLPPLRALRLSAVERVTLTVPAAATVLHERLAGDFGLADIVCNPTLMLRPRRALLSGTLVGNVNESAIRTIDHTLVISLSADSFVPSVGIPTSEATLALIAGVGSTLALGLRPENVYRISATAVRILVRYALQQSYAINVPETVVVTLPAAALESRVAFPVSPSFVISAVPGAPRWYQPFFSPTARTVQLTAADVRDTVADYETFVDLVDDVWVASLGSESAATSALLAGIVSMQSEASSWNAVVRPQLTASAVRRVSNARIEIIISGHPSYELVAPETLRLVVPGAALVSGQPRLASGPLFIITPQRGSAALSGSLLADSYERQVQSVMGARLVLTLLQGERWVPTLGQLAPDGTQDLCTTAMVDRLTLDAGATQEFGWQNVVQVALRERLETALIRESYTRLSIQLPQLLIYKLDQGAERITAAIPRACLLSGNELRAADGHIANAPFSVLPAVGRAYVSGSLLNDAREVTVQMSASQLRVRLLDDIFVGDESGIPSILFGSLGGAAGAWASVVRPALEATCVGTECAAVSIVCAMNGVVIACSSDEIRSSALETTISINFDPAAAYQISEPETIEIRIPGELLASRQTILASPPFVIQVAGAEGLVAYGSMIDGGSVDEAAMQSGALQNVTIELVGDTFGASPSAGVLQGLVSAQNEPYGWGALMRPSLSVDHFQLLSNTTLALYFRGLGGYDISAPETIAIEVPASAVSSGQVPPSVPSFTITASAGVAAFTSDGLALARGAPCMTASSCAAAEALLNSSNELAISGPQTLQVVIELLGNTFRHDVGHDRWASEAVLSSLFASGGARESSGWNRVVRPLLGRSSRYLTRLSD
jgi:hypothetical protein